MSNFTAVRHRMRGLVNDGWVRLSARGKRIPTHWYRKRTNFGDMLSPILLEHVAGRAPTWVSEYYPGKVIALGSLLHRLQPGDVVWGAGSIRDKPIDVPGVRYLAVRGPLTRHLIRGDVPQVYGDPAVLLPRLYQALVSIDPLLPWRDVVDQIAECQVVISSSLHGIIVAEAYGIAAVWTQASDRLVGGTFKFRDYYLSTGREIGEPVPWQRGIEAALRRVPGPGTVDTEALVEAWVDPQKWA